MGSLVDMSDGLDPGLTLLASPGYPQRARELGRRVAAARQLFAAVLDVDLDQVRVLVLDEADWHEHCPFPEYGMPFSQAPEALYAAAADNPLWRAAVPDLATLPPPVAARLTEVYGEPSGFSARRFFDLLVVHELAHLFLHRGGLQLPRRWLEELFCNLALHTFVEQREPEQLPALETLPEIVASMPIDLLPHHTLADWERLFENVGPMAFAWYQCRLHRAAADVYRADGPDSMKAMWTFFADSPGAPGAPTRAADRDLRALLTSLSPHVAEIATTWPGTR